MTNEQKEFIKRITGINMEDGLPNAIIHFSERDIINTQYGHASSTRVINQINSAAVEIYENEKEELAIVLLFSDEDFADYARILELSELHMMRRRRHAVSEECGCVGIKRELWISLKDRNCEHQLDINIGTMFSLCPIDTATIIAFVDDIKDGDVKFLDK